MTAHAATAPTPAAAGPLDRHHFLLRRLHSLSGIVPVGVFVCFHLFTNFQMVFGTFQHEVDFIHSMPALLFVEVFGLWLPIAFHAALGVVYTFTGKGNVKNYSYFDNVRYTLQRVTGILALIFILLHVATLRWGWSFAGVLDTPFYTRQHLAGGTAVDLAHASTAYAVQHSVWVFAVYVIGVFSVVYHWSNGLWTAAISWGLTLSPASQKRWGQVCAGMGVVLSIFSAGALYAAMTYDIPEDVDALMAQLRSGEVEYDPHGLHLVAVPDGAPAGTPAEPVPQH